LKKDKGGKQEKAPKQPEQEKYSGREAKKSPYLSVV
jgi:hypothetical protein